MTFDITGRYVGSSIYQGVQVRFYESGDYAWFVIGFDLIGVDKTSLLHKVSEFYLPFAIYTNNILLISAIQHYKWIFYLQCYLSFAIIILLSIHDKWQTVFQIKLPFAIWYTTD